MAVKLGPWGHNMSNNGDDEMTYWGQTWREAVERCTKSENLYWENQQQLYHDQARMVWPSDKENWVNKVTTLEVECQWTTRKTMQVMEWSYGRQYERLYQWRMIQIGRAGWEPYMGRCWTWIQQKTYIKPKIILF